jgi:uncharacterized protein (TIGR02145 family)
MPTATVLGDVYETIIMPDGKEWVKTNIRNAAIQGYEVNNDSNNRPLYGRLYVADDISSAPFSDGWHIPSRQEWGGLMFAVSAQMVIDGISDSVIDGIKTSGTTDWNGGWGRGLYGFDLRGASYCNTTPAWAAFKTNTYFHVSDPVVGQKVVTCNDNDNAYLQYVEENLSNYAFSVRVLRTPVGDFSGVRPAQSGSWRNASDVHVAKDGVWRKANRIFVPVSGAWREVL